MSEATCTTDRHTNNELSVLKGIPGKYCFMQPQAPPTTNDKNSPPVNLYVLSVEEEDGRGNDADVKVLCVNGDFVYIHDVHSSHFGDKHLILCKLRRSQQGRGEELASPQPPPPFSVP